jgi:hypothetical protein
MATLKSQTPDCNLLTLYLNSGINETKCDVASGVVIIKKQVFISGISLANTYLNSKYFYQNRLLNIIQAFF